MNPVREYYYDILKHKLAGDEDYLNIPLDMCTERAENNKCLSCGSPKMEDAMTPYECRVCAVKRVGQAEYDRYVGLKNSSVSQTGHNPNQFTESKTEDEESLDLPF